jgi:DNA helicase-2/ATP-dependent DNA helicase PcrA
VLDRYGLFAGVEPGQRVLADAQRAELCAKVLDEMAFERASSTWQPTLVANILGLAEQAANHGVTPERIVAFNEARSSDQGAGRRQGARRHQGPYGHRHPGTHRPRPGPRPGFQELKRRMGVIDFGDQITLALSVVERFRKRP